MNIFRSVENINPDTVIAFKSDGITHNFPDEYNMLGKNSGNNI